MIDSRMCLKFVVRLAYQNILRSLTTVSLAVFENRSDMIWNVT